MKRVASIPRPNWEKTIHDQGLIYNETVLPDGASMSYWNETACYEFSLAEVEKLEGATAELFEMCIAAGDHILENGLHGRLGISDSALPAIKQTWYDDNTPSVYGRFDLCYTADGTIKLLEFNADTPTSLLEASAVQWFWLQDTTPKLDQWNSIHDRLVAAWKRRSAAGHLKPGPVHFASSQAETSGEDYFTTVYMQETAHQAGLKTQYLPIEAVGLENGTFIDESNQPVTNIFKLYPWEWMMNEDFGKAALASITKGATRWIEPAYKMLWSNKGLLPVLWELYPNHPLLLESYFDGPGTMADYAAKPLLGREGQGVKLVKDGQELASGAGVASLGKRIYQALAELPDHDGNRPVLGAWVVDGEPAGLGIRESDGPITDNLSRFVPHRIVG